MSKQVIHQEGTLGLVTVACLSIIPGFGTKGTLPLYVKQLPETAPVRPLGTDHQIGGKAIPRGSFAKTRQPGGI